VRKCYNVIRSINEEKSKIFSSLTKKVNEGKTEMNTFQYIVDHIDGDYAYLRRIDEESDELKLVARALLPPEIMEGSQLLYEWMQYSII